MNRKNVQNINGISISDSIIMSVKQKHTNLRKLYSSIIAFIGIISVIMAFLGMFNLNYNKNAVFLSGMVILAFYITVSAIGGKALWLYGISVFIFLISLLKYYLDKVPDNKNQEKSKLILGFEYVANIVAKTVDKAEKFTLDADLEIPLVTTFFILYLWLLAIVVCFFTICRPNPVFPILITFPLIEIGLFYGVKMPVFWGILCIAYWLAVMAMSTIDVGEYSGGQSGFVRKNNLFFPKRHMKLKVTEKCGILVICSVMLIAFVSSGFLKLTHYERSEKINQKRRDISNAASYFSFSNLGESLSLLMNSLGINIEYESHKLGTQEEIKYKNVVDLTITLDKSVSGTLYLKGYVGSEYNNNEWFKLPSDKYKDSLFKDFKNYGVYPQDFSINNYNMSVFNPNKNNIVIFNKRKKKNIYAPYLTFDEEMSYINDTQKTPLKKQKDGYHYSFCPDDIVNKIYQKSSENVADKSKSLDLDDIYSTFSSKDNISKIVEYYSSKGRLFDQKYLKVNYSDFIDLNPDKITPEGLITLLFQEEYKEFARQNYLQYPQNDDMNEIHNHYSYIVDGRNIDTAVHQLEVLDSIKNELAKNTYTTLPGSTPPDKDFVKDFLFDRKKGYCIHFATAGVILARMANIPARYVTGYVVTESDLQNIQQNKDGKITVDVKDNRSHAWAEVYLEKIGWVPYEFTPSNAISDDQTQSQIQSATSTASSTSVNPSSASSNSTEHSTQITTTQKSTSVINSSDGNSENTITTLKVWLAPYLKTLKTIVKFMIYCIFAFIVLVLRRYFILRIRKRSFTTGNAADRVINIYSFAEKLLKEMNLKSEMSNYLSFAEEVERYHGSIYFDDGGFRHLTDIALRTKFSKTVPDIDDVQECMKVVDQLSNNLYNKSSRLRKLKFRYINVLR